MEPFWDARKFSAGQSTTQYAEILPESLLHLRPLSQPSNFTRTLTVRYRSAGRSEIEDQPLAFLLRSEKMKSLRYYAFPFWLAHGTALLFVCNSASYLVRAAIDVRECRHCLGTSFVLPIISSNFIIQKFISLVNSVNIIVSRSKCALKTAPITEKLII